MADFVDEAVIEANVRLEAVQTGKGVFRCTLTSDYNQMVRDITVKDGVDHAPDAANLLYHFALVSQGVLDCDDISDWADEFGYNAKEAATQATYQHYCLDAKDLRLLLGSFTFENLMSGLAIAQAISNARPE